MKNIILVLGLFVLLFPSKGQSQWNTVPSGTTASLQDITFINNQTGFIVGTSGTLLKTIDGGNSWSQITVPTSVHLIAISFPTSLVGYVSGNSGRVLKTTDGGTSWNVLITPVASSLSSLDFCDANIGYVVGTGKTILKTTDGGNSWITQMNGGTMAFASVHCLNEQEVVVAGTNGFIYKSLDGGNTWLSKTSPTTDGLFEIRFIENTGYICGSSVILKTMNRGEDWVVASTLTGGVQLRAMIFISSSVGFAAGQSGFIYKTVDGGANWVAENSGSTASFLGLSYNNAHIFAVGGVLGEGIILRTGNPIGIQNISSEIPADYKLSQNYPNPFNPITNIKFSIPSKGTVQLTVFDITGKVVNTLVNDVLSAGSYVVDFNANNLASGTYFYRLQTKDFVESRKMTLVK